MAPVIKVFFELRLYSLINFILIHQNLSNSAKKKSDVVVVKGDDAKSPESDGLNAEDFHSAVTESASKLIIHYGGLTKKVLAAGDMPVSFESPA